MNEVKCINKQPRDNFWERITHLWWTNWKWGYRKLTQTKVIEYIETWNYNFYVDINNKNVKLIVAKSRFWNKYVKTEADGDEPNNLLSLPECKS